MLNNIKTQRVQTGCSVDFLASAAVTSGDPVQLADGRIGIVIADTAAGAYGAAEVQPGVLYRGVKATGNGTALTAGSALWWNASTKVYGASGTFRVGIVEEDALTTDDVVLFALNADQLTGCGVADHVATNGSMAELVTSLVGAGLMAGS